MSPSGCKGALPHKDVIHTDPPGNEGLCRHDRLEGGASRALAGSGHAGAPAMRQVVCASECTSRDSVDVDHVTRTDGVDRDSHKREGERERE